MAELGVASVVDVQVVLPDHWWVIPLYPPEARARSVERQFAGIDDQPLLRRHLPAAASPSRDGRRLRWAADGAEPAADRRRPRPGLAGGALDDVPASPGSTPGDGSLLMCLREAFAPASGALGFTLDLGKMAAGTVLRRVHELPAALDGAEPTPSLVADYWCERPDGAGLVQLAFATPMLPLRQPLLELFDAVVGALHWVTAAEPEATTALCLVHSP